MIDILKNSLDKGIVTKPLVMDDTIAKGMIGAAGAELKAEIARVFNRSFHMREVDTGSCGACESEIIAATNPIYDVQRFGVDFVASPRHADALLVTGPVSRNMELALKRTYEAMPGPRLVITLGDCALYGGIYRNSYYVLNGVRNVLPVNLHIPGCPPKPINIITSLLFFLRSCAQPAPR